METLPIDIEHTIYRLAHAPMMDSIPYKAWNFYVKRSRQRLDLKYRVRVFKTMFTFSNEYQRLVELSTSNMQNSTLWYGYRRFWVNKFCELIIKNAKLAYDFRDGPAFREHLGRFIAVMEQECPYLPGLKRLREIRSNFTA